MQVQPLRGLKALGELLLKQRVVVQVPPRPEAWVELLCLKTKSIDGRDFVLRMGPVTTQPMTESEARQRLLEESAFLINRGR
jgi:hypothetical protein